MTAVARLGLFGGTFDPIHVGHLDVAEAARAAVLLPRVCLIPSGSPPHRFGGPQASAQDRMAMVRLAVKERAGFDASDSEMLRPGQSYTVDTLQEFHRHGWAPSQLFFIMGADAFADLATWRAFPEVMAAAHFVVVRRPGTGWPVPITEHPAVRSRLCTPDTMRPDASETAIIHVEAHTRDVAASTIRQYVAAGKSIDDWVPPLVAEYIAEHYLYTSVDNLHEHITPD